MIKTLNNINLFDKSYQKSKASTYKLYVEVSYSSLQQLVLDTTTNTFIGFKEHVFADVNNDFTLCKQLEEVIKSDELFNQNYKSIIIALVNNRATLVPNAIYKSEQLDSYHHFNFSIQEDDQFYTDKLINLNAHNVYSISKNISSLFNHLKNVQFKHFSSSLIEAALIDAKVNKAISSIYVNVLPSSFQVIVIKNQKLEFFNSFTYKTNEDFIYYLLFAMDQLNINNEDATINLTGNIEKNTELYSTLFKYINTLNFTSLSGNLIRSYVFEDIPKHYYYGLFNLYLCE